MDYRYQTTAGGGWTTGTDGVKGHFTKAAKTHSDVDFSLIFHIST